MNFKTILYASIGAILCSTSLVRATTNTSTSTVQLTVNFPGLSSMHISVHLPDA